MQVLGKILLVNIKEKSFKASWVKIIGKARKIYYNKRQVMNYEKIIYYKF